jgi:hypothetical protein
VSSDGLVILLAVGIPLAVLAFVAVLLVFIFGRVRAATARARAALEHEGIALDSGPQWITVHYRNFRAPGLYRGVAVTKTRGSLILTRPGRIVLIPLARGRYWLAPPNVTVRVAPDGALHIHSDQPSGQGVSGSIDVRVAAIDASAWMVALTQAGARLAGAAT